MKITKDSLGSVLEYLRESHLDVGDDFLKRIKCVPHRFFVHGITLRDLDGFNFEISDRHQVTFASIELRGGEFYLHSITHHLEPRETWLKINGDFVRSKFPRLTEKQTLTILHGPQRDFRGHINPQWPSNHAGNS